MQALQGKERLTILAALVVTVASGICSYMKVNEVVVFVMTGIGLAPLRASRSGSAPFHEAR